MGKLRYDRIFEDISEYRTPVERSARLDVLGCVLVFFMVLSFALGYVVGKDSARTEMAEEYYIMQTENLNGGDDGR